jgi:hypothetical protein
MTDTINSTINKFAYGYVFTSRDFPIDVSKHKSINKVLENLAKAGKIRRLSKGRFYKAKVTEFGELPPDSNQIVKDLLTENGKSVGYITGYQIFADLHLTTQIPAILQIGANNEKKSKRRGYYRISFVKQWNIITKENIPLLQLLDCLRFFKIIPDTMPQNSCRRLLALLSELTENQKNKLKKLALKYPPQAIALLGAMLETLNPDENLEKLRESLNFQTFYRLYIPQEVLPTQRKWNIR